MRRALIALGIAGGAVLAFLLLQVAAASPASAMEREGITVTIDHPVDVDEPALIGDNPANTTVGEVDTPVATANASLTPGDCLGIQTYCDTVPLHIVAPPGLSVFDSWFAYVTVSWNRDQPGGCPADPLLGATPCNDVDIFTFDDGQINRAGGRTGFTDTGDSASGDEPEVAKMFQPGLGDYNLVVNNFAGVNQGYHVNVHLELFKGVRPFELLGPTLTVSGDSGTPGSPSAPGSFPSGAPGGGAIDFGPNGPALDPAPIAPDAAFNDFPIAESDFRAPPKGPGLLAELINSKPKTPKAVSGLLLIVTMLLIPLLVTASIIGWAYRRRQASFGF